jgi:hypothetical protein
MPYYLTTYALTKGIFEMPKEARLQEGKYLSYGPFFTTEFQHARESAIEQGEKMRKRKIASLKKQIAKLEELDIKILPWPPR